MLQEAVADVSRLATIRHRVGNCQERHLLNADVAGRIGLPEADAVEGLWFGGFEHRRLAR
jgi:hypothetical protein